MLRRRCFAWLSLLVLCACSSDPKPSTGSEPEAEPDLDGVVYVDGTTDEALERLFDKKAKDDPTQYVLVDAPNLDEPISADSPATFEFHLASEAQHLPTPKPVAAPPPAWRRPLRELLQLLGPVRTAYAHGVPFNGTAYYLEFEDADGKAVLAVFCGKNSYTPSASSWQSLVDAKQPLSLDITSAFFEDNDVRADGGPYEGGGSFELRIE